jgi:hypothetical protein
MGVHVLVAGSYRAPDVFPPHIKRVEPIGVRPPVVAVAGVTVQVLVDGLYVWGVPPPPGKTIITEPIQ